MDKCLFCCSCHVLCLLFLLANFSRAEVPVVSNGYSALCTVARDENPFLREWVEYHKCQGFSKIYLYDHKSKVPLSEAISEYIESGFVTYQNTNETHRKSRSDDGFTTNIDAFMKTIQGKSYQHCLATYGPKHKFLGFLDVDEFLVLHDLSLDSVNDLLKDYEDFGGLSVYWIHLGTSGKKRTAGPVVSSFRSCTPQNHRLNTQFKSFVNTEFDPQMYSPHRAHFRREGLNPFLVNEDKGPIPRGRNNVSYHRRASVYHYVTRSAADFAEKRRRGGGAGVTRPASLLQYVDRACVEQCDGAMQNFERLCGKLER